MNQLLEAGFSGLKSQWVRMDGCCSPGRAIHCSGSRPAPMSLRGRYRPPHLVQDESMDAACNLDKRGRVLQSCLGNVPHVNPQVHHTLQAAEQEDEIAALLGIRGLENQAEF